MFKKKCGKFARFLNIQICKKRVANLLDKKLQIWIKISKFVFFLSQILPHFLANFLLFSYKLATFFMQIFCFLLDICLFEYLANLPLLSGKFASISFSFFLNGPNTPLYEKSVQQRLVEKVCHLELFTFKST